jgi:hypothetical protein
VSDTAVPETPGPGEMVTATTPMPLRRLDAVDDPSLPGPSAVGPTAGSAPLGGGPVVPLVAQRSLPLYTVPEPSSSFSPSFSPAATTPAGVEPPAPAPVPIRWESATGGASAGFGGGSYDGSALGGGGTGGGGLGGGLGAAGGGAVAQRAVDVGAGRLGADRPVSSSAVPASFSSWFSSRPSPMAPPVSLAASSPLTAGTTMTLPSTAATSSSPFEVQRLADPPAAASMPLRRAPAAGRSLSSSDAGAVAVAAGVAQRMPDGSVVFAPPMVQRADGDLPVTEPPPAAPPAPPEPTGGTGDASAGAGGTQGAGGGAEGKAAGAGSGAPKVTDELVRALVAPLSRLLRAELRIERERTGSLINTRH